MSKDFMVNAENAITSAGSSVASTLGGVVDSAKSAVSSARNFVNKSTNTAGAGRGFINPAAASPYAHNANNTVTSTAADSLSFQFQPNILDNYDTITYHWKLFIVSTEDSSTGNVLSLNQQTIIAESGVSDLTIDKVSIRTLATPSIESGTGTSVDVKFEIVEPAGAGLIDKLFYQSVALGIGNWLVMPVYLQLEFRARDPETSNSGNGMPGAIGNLKWVWPLRIVDVKANVTTVGTRYDFTAIPYNQITQANTVFSLQQNIVLSEIDTFSSAMNELSDILNADQLVKLAGNYSIPDTFNIIVDPAIAGFKITPSTHNTDSVRNDNFLKFDGKTAVANSGTSIDKIIDSLLSQTEEYQKSMVGAQMPGQQGQSMNAEISQMKKFWRIITEARPLAFDKRRCTNANEYTIFIIEYDIGILDSNASQTSRPPFTLESSKKRLATYVKKNILKKKYNYMFTGLNDQVHSFDLNLNFAFAAALSRLDGVYKNSAMSSIGVVNQDHSKEEQEVTSQLNKAIALQHNSKTSSSQAGAAAVANAKASIKSANIDEDTKLRYMTLLDHSKPADRLAYLKSVQAAGGINNNGTLSQSRQQATSLADNVGTFPATFLSDVNINSPKSTEVYKSFLESTRSKLRPTAYVETGQDMAVGLGIESSSNSGIQKLSSVFSTALHSGLDASLQSIKMTIKGDPFWLSPQPIIGNQHQLFNSLKPVAEAMSYLKNQQFTSGTEQSKLNYANLIGTDNFFIVRFRTPRLFNLVNDNTDSPDPFTEIETFSGVYKVISVVSKFEMGKFSQDMDAILDPEIRLLDFQKEIEAASKKIEIPTTAGDIVTRNSSLPSKTQRIMGAADINGVELQARNLAGKAVALGSSTVGGAVATAKANIPTPITNIIAGLPNKFG